MCYLQPPMDVGHLQRSAHEHLLSVSKVPSTEAFTQVKIKCITAFYVLNTNFSLKSSLYKGFEMNLQPIASRIIIKDTEPLS